MIKLKTIFWIRPVALIILIVSVLMFVQCYFLESFLQEITGTKASARISMLDLMKGEIGLKNVLIYSPETHYNGVRAIFISRITLTPEWTTLFSKKKIIKRVNVHQVLINNIYDQDGNNNIKDILSNVIKHFNNAGKSPEKCSIKNLAITTIMLKTRYKNTPPVIAFLPDIHAKNIKGNGMVNVIGSTLSQNLNADFRKNDGRSFWQKTADGINTVIDVLAIGAATVRSTTDMMNQTQYTFNSY